MKGYTLDKKDVVNMICGIDIGLRAYSVDDNAMEVLQEKKVGTYYGGFSNEWNWNRSELEALELPVLVDLYMKIKY